MNTGPGKISQFWNELKRRNVIRVVTVYAGASFVILELLDIITDPLKLPSWLLPVAIVMLSIGFIIAIILSWIYDIHPEDGVIRTGSTAKLKTRESTSTGGWKVASYISFVVIIGLAILNIVPRSRQKVSFDKSIAVLPFINDSPDESKMYFINGTMEAILDNLSRIKDLSVQSRTSVEQYRDHPKPIPEVAEALNVNYVLEGSGHRDGENVRIFVQLLEGKSGHHLWSHQYDASMSDIFFLQSQIAQQIASEIEAIITPEEKQLIEKESTSNLEAYDAYSRAREEHWLYWEDQENIEALDNAEKEYLRAIELDSSYAEAYTGLARVYWDSNYSSELLSDKFMEPVLTLIIQALSYDNQLPEAYLIMGDYLYETGKAKEAISFLDRANDLNPNYWEAYQMKGLIYSVEAENMELAIYNLSRALELHHGRSRANLMRNITLAYQWLGFFHEANIFVEEAMDLNGDSALYYLDLARSESYMGHIDGAVQLLNNAYAIDPEDLDILYRLGYEISMTDQNKQSLPYFERWLDKMDELGLIQRNAMHRIAFAFWVNGLEKEADEYFDLQYEWCLESIRLNRTNLQNRYVYYDLASIDAFRGKKEKALQYLRAFNERTTMPSWVVSLIRIDPLFENIRNEPEFLLIVRDVEAKYQAEHDRVKKWLEENMNLAVH